MENQSKILDIPIIPQPGTSLCWAAAIQMTMRANASNTQMLDLIQYLLVLRTSAPLTDGEKTEFERVQNQSNQESFVDDSSGKNWNIDIRNYMSKVHNYFDAIFLENDFYSIEEFELSTVQEDINQIWRLIMNQINKQKRPLILVIKDAIYAHAVVVRGYWVRDNVKYLCVNDPLSNLPFEGECYSLHYENLMSNDFGIKAKSLIHNIRLKNDFRAINSSGEHTNVDDYDILSDENVMRIGQVLGNN